MQTPPTGVAEQTQWLVDRAAIHDLLVHLAICNDQKGPEDVAACYAPEGVIVTPYREISREEVAEAVAQILGPFDTTHHAFTNILIKIDGDAATTQHYVIAAHVPDGTDPSAHADVGGWYECSYRRTDEGWRITRLDLSFVYSSGLPFVPGGTEPAQA